jgi:spore maturation protein CgeB
MRIVIFCHSLVSDWNHGNAHFIRGVVTELLELGHEVEVFEPRSAWSLQGLIEDTGSDMLQQFESEYPGLRSLRYSLETLDLSRVLDGAELVLVHEWNDPELVRRVGDHHVQHPEYTLLFHDTHHRSISAPDEMARYHLQSYDAVLAFGEAVRTQYLRQGWASRVFVWHEAADARKFAPVEAQQKRADLVWIGNFGDDERTAELDEFLIDPVRRLGISATVYGVRYPETVRAKLQASGIVYGGYLPNWEVPRVFSEHKLTIHVPRRPYARDLPGIPTIRPFEAMASGIPLVSAPWDDREGLFGGSRDYLTAHDGIEMYDAIGRLLQHPELAKAMAERARRTIVSRHTCRHRVAELLSIRRALSVARSGHPAEAAARDRPLAVEATSPPFHRSAETNPTRDMAQ